VRLRLDYLSPLPPVRSGIADYSIDLLPHLRRQADVRVLRLRDLPVEPSVAERFEVRDSAERAGEEGRLPLYHMGNNRYHEQIWELAHQRPGVVVLHDFVLHHFLLNRTMGAGDWQGYHDELERCHGWIGDAASRPVRWGAHGRSVQFELPANRTLLEFNRGVIVHGRWAAERLREEDPRLAVRIVSMAIPLPAAASRERGLAFRRARGIPATAPLLGSFGFQTPIKRTEVAIAALSRPGLERFHLLVAGELSEYSDHAALAAKLGVGDRVHVTGFLPFEELDAAIASSDLCLNLRYPSAGETSASLLRILAVGRPVAVSDYAEFGELPDDIALHVPLGDDEEERFASGVAEWMESPDRLTAAGERARRWVAEHHDPERCATAMVDAVAELAELEPPGFRPPEVPRSSSLVDARLRSEVEVEGLDGWSPGERRPIAITLVNRGAATWRPSREIDGGILVEVELCDAERRILPGVPWFQLQQPLEPGERVRFELELRRPLAPSQIRVRPNYVLADLYGSRSEWRFERWL